VRMRYRYPWRPASVGVGAVLAGWAMARMGWPTPGLRLAGFGAVVVVAVSAWWWLRHVARPHSTKATIARRAELDQRSEGAATMLDIAEIASPRALRLQARVLRPSTTARMSWWARHRMPPHELGVQVARLGWGLWGQQVWSSIEDATLRIGGPRMGKTISLAPYGLKAPGTLVTTSTRLDLAEAVHAARVRHGVVHVFNPAGLGGVPSTVRWRVLDGCADYATADRRAADLIPPSEGERALWDTQARRVLALLLNAAALSGRSMREVVRWSAGDNDAALKEVIDGLLEAGDSARDRVTAVQDYWATNPRTKSSIAATMAIPLAWISDDRARALGDAAPDDPALVDIAAVIGRGQTLHLLGHEQRGTVAPLIGAFVAEIAHAARTLAGDQPGGRLDPPVTMLLDEAAIVVPVPLDQWTADMGGSGITLHMSVQSLAQMRARWGEERANALLANIACFVVFGGSAIHDDLAKISALTGSHRMKVIGIDHQHDDDRDGELRGEYQWVPVLSAAQIRALHPGQVLVLRRNLHTVIGQAPRHTPRSRDLVPLPRTDAEALAQLQTLWEATPSRVRRLLTTAGQAVPAGAARTKALHARAAAATRWARRGAARPGSHDLSKKPATTPDDVAGGPGRDGEPV
jgi:type IV secretion system protein VirD4